MVSFEEVATLLRYEPKTGLFFWRVDRAPLAKAGSEAGSYSNGYVTIMVLGKNYRAHRLAWLLTYGEAPVDDIDHINGDPADNRIVNLRAATRSQNLANCKRRRDNKSGFKGVDWHKRMGKFRARLHFNGGGAVVGYFDTAEDAHAAYVAAAKKHFGEFSRSA